MKMRFNLRNVAKMTVASLAVIAAFISCEKDDSGGGGTLGGSQSPIGQVGNSFNLGGISGIANNASAQIAALDNGVSTVSISANVTNATYRNMLSAASDVSVTGTTATRSIQCRFTDAGIQSVYPEGNINVVKFNAKVGDVYTLQQGSNTLRREVTVVSNENSYSWNGMNIKTIHVKETGRGVPGLDYIEYVTNHKFGIVGVKFFFEDGTSLPISLVSGATNQ